MSGQSSIRGAFKRLAAGADSGIAAVEFAIIVPIFLILIAGSVDVGRMLFDYYELDQAVAAGAEYAALNAANVTSANGAALASSVATVVESANGSAWANNTVVVNNGPTVTVTSGAATSSGTASNADSYYCLTGTAGNWTWGTAYATQASCAAGGTAGKFVTITASYRYTPLVTFYTSIAATTLTQNTVVQTQ